MLADPKTTDITEWGVLRSDPDCPTCVWLKQHRGGKARKYHFCGIEFSQDIHDSQIADESAENDLLCMGHEP